MTVSADDIPMSRDAQAAMWCLTLAEGELDAQEQHDFDLWIADPANAATFEEAARVWRAADQAADLPEAIRVRAASFEQLRRAQKQRWTRGFRRWPAIGAVAALLLALVLGGTLLRSPTTTYRTGLGERRVAMLADGSRISLDGDTEVGVRLGRDRRELVLVHGRAKFDVAHDPSRPFSVAAADRIVIATGTSFSVELLQRKARVLLYEGHVAVLDTRAKASGASRDEGGALTPGHELVVAADAPGATAIVHPVDVARSRSWEGGQLDFDDEALPSAVERMNRYSPRKLVIGDAAAARLHVDGVFDAGNVEAFVGAVTRLNHVRAERRDDDIILSGG